ncbi:hypothetical protein H8959_002496 [Pygathrix nigripes]
MQQDSGGAPTPSAGLGTSISQEICWQMLLLLHCTDEHVDAGKEHATLWPARSRAETWTRACDDRSSRTGEHGQRTGPHALWNVFHPTLKPKGDPAKVRCQLREKKAMKVI